jgi:hypothetical protein
VSEEGTVRSTAEMQFVASLSPCPSCAAATPRLDFYRDTSRCILSGLCPSCRAVRRFDFMQLHAQSPTLGVGETTAAGHVMHAEVEHADQRVSTVTLHFAPSARSRRA